MGIRKKKGMEILFGLLPSQRSDMTALRWQKFSLKIYSGSVSTMQQCIINNISKNKH